MGKVYFVTKYNDDDAKDTYLGIYDTLSKARERLQRLDCMFLESDDEYGYTERWTKRGDVWCRSYYIQEMTLNEDKEG